MAFETPKPDFGLDDLRERGFLKIYLMLMPISIHH